MSLMCLRVIKVNAMEEAELELGLETCIETTYLGGGEGRKYSA